MVFKQHAKLYLVAASITIFFLVYQLFHYNNVDIIEAIQMGHHPASSSAFQNDKKQAIFPENFLQDVQHIELYAEYYFNDDLNGDELVEMKQSEPFYYGEAMELKPHEFKSYHGAENINGDNNMCSKLETKSILEISEAKPIDVSLRNVMTKFLQEYESNKYYKEVAPFFIKDLQEQLNTNSFEKHWYRLAGTSVWLKDYNVHLMISRVIYTPKQSRNQPIVSLSYAQIFTKDWEELSNTKLVVPTNDLGSPKKREDIFEAFRVMEFPMFLPIPFYHDYHVTAERYYGPEDPRIMLVRNERGYDEPLIIFNSYHRKLVSQKKPDSDETETTAQYYRSIFVCWPWQLQIGKENVDGVPHPKYDDNKYSKIVELKIKNQEKQKIQKNWTPFVSENERQVFGYDNSINFVNRWSYMEVLQCDLVGETPGLCSFQYKALGTDPGAVGPFRGGTELLNLNHLLKLQTDLDLKKLLPENREIWVGFARTHLNGCGCGSAFYRPNLVLVVGDTVAVKSDPNDISSPSQAKTLYKLSHVSSSISFDVPIIGWNLDNPKQVCEGANVFIPNGISSWMVKSAHENKTSGVYFAEDYLTLSLSLSDATVHTIVMKGLLNAIFQFIDGSLFYPAVGGKVQSSEEIRAKLLLPDPKIVADPEMDNFKYLIGYNNDNINCALNSSMDFCKTYSSNILSSGTEQ